MGGTTLTGILLGCLNTGLVLGGIAVQLPQIGKIWTTKSVDGLSEASCIIQTFSTGFYCAYNYVNGIPFMTWGDAFFAVVEYVIIVCLVWAYGPPANRISETHGNVRKIAIFGFITILLLTLTKKSPLWLTTLMGIAPMPMVVAGRLSQIVENHKNKSAGQLSFASLVMQCGGNFARIVSTLFLVPDAIVLLCHLTAFVFNAAPLLQLIYYDILNRDLRNCPVVATHCLEKARRLVGDLTTNPGHRRRKVSPASAGRQAVNLPPASAVKQAPTTAEVKNVPQQKVHMTSAARSSSKPAFAEKLAPPEKSVSETEHAPSTPAVAKAVLTAQQSLPEATARAPPKEAPAPTQTPASKAKAKSKAPPALIELSEEPKVRKRLPRF